MTRSDGDSWDVASSVGVTATMAAAARALASREPNRIINDQFAAPLVRAVGIDYFTRLVDNEIVATNVGDSSRPKFQPETDLIAIRTRFFDEFFVGATAAGIRQVVIVAAGLDSRSYRLAWPPGSVVYEVDQPKVIDFKTATMLTLGAAPTAQRRSVGIDLREDWPTALRRSGFVEDLPSAWSAEGLLMYLPPEAQDRLFDNITALSASGSTLATEYHPDTGPRMAERAQTLNDRFANLGWDVDLPGLFYEGERSNVVDYLTGWGWQVTTRSRRELFADYGRTFPDDDVVAPFRNVISVVATRRREPPE